MDSDKKPNKLLGLSCGTFTAWIAVPLIHLVSILFDPNSTDVIGGLQFLGLVMLPLYVMFGLPIAVILFFTIGGSAWYICEALNMVHSPYRIRLSNTTNPYRHRLCDRNPSLWVQRLDILQLGFTQASQCKRLRFRLTYGKLLTPQRPQA